MRVVDFMCRASPVRASGEAGRRDKLIVEGHPYLILGGELANSSASSLQFLQNLWPVLEGAGLNTELAPLEWDQFEPATSTYVPAWVKHDVRRFPRRAMRRAWPRIF